VDSLDLLTIENKLKELINSIDEADILSVIPTLLSLLSLLSLLYKDENSIQKGYSSKSFKLSNKSNLQLFSIWILDAIQSILGQYILPGNECFMILKHRK
jgi:hypothetical protein